MPPSEQPIKVMIVDDHSIFRAGIRNSLAGKPRISIIGEAENGLDLLQQIEHLQPDVITLNIQMPVMDGIETLPLLKRKYPGIKVLVISMHSGAAIICRMIELGANGYLTKDVGSDEIYKAILAFEEHWFYVNDTVIDALAAFKKPADQQPVSFSNKEIQVAQLLSEGLAEAGIAEQVDLARRTVSVMIDRLLVKTRTATRQELAAFAKANWPRNEGAAREP
jgi:DNA-binding NarL/FixJ family response regulator